MDWLAHITAIILAILFILNGYLPFMLFSILFVIIGVSIEVLRTINLFGNRLINEIRRLNIK